MVVKNTVEHVLQNQVPVGAENDNYDANDRTQFPRLLVKKNLLGMQNMLKIKTLKQVWKKNLAD